MHRVKMRELKVLLENHDTIFKRKMISKKNGVRRHPRQKLRPGRRPRLNKEETQKLGEMPELIIKDMSNNEDHEFTLKRFTRATTKESPGPFEFIELKSPRRKRRRRSSSLMVLKLQVKKEDEGGNDGVPSSPKRKKCEPKNISHAKETVVKQEDDVETASHEDDSVTSEDSFVDLSQSHDLISEEYHIIEDESVGAIVNNENDQNLINNKTVYRQFKLNDTGTPRHLNNDLDSTETVGEVIVAEDNHFQGSEEQKNIDIFTVAKEQDFVNNNETDRPVYTNETEKMEEILRKRKNDDNQQPRKMRCLEEVVSEIFDKKILLLEKRAFLQNKREFEALKDEALQRELKNEAKLNHLEALLITAINNSQDVGTLLQKLATEKRKRDQSSQTEDLQQQDKVDFKAAIDQATQTEEAEKQNDLKQIGDQMTHTEEQVQTSQALSKNGEIGKSKKMEERENFQSINNAETPTSNEKMTKVEQLKLPEKPKENVNDPQNDKQPKPIDRSKQEVEPTGNIVNDLQDHPSSTQDLSLIAAIDRSSTPSDHHISIFDRLGNKTDEPDSVSAKCSPSNRSLLSVSPENTPPPALTPIELQREEIQRELKACNIIVKGFRYSSKTIKMDLDFFFRKKMNINSNIIKVEAFGNSLLVVVGSPAIREEIIKKKGILKRSTVFLKPDYTGRERKVQTWLKLEAQRRSRNGRNIIVSYQKIRIDGVWWYWNDLEGRLSRRLFRPELVAM